MLATTTKSELQLLAANSLLTLLACGGVSYLYYLDPVDYAYLVTEDCWGEYASFVGWGTSFGLLTAALWSYPSLRKPGLILLACASLILALEEISWGQRIFGFETPGPFLVRNEQSEMNLHNWAGDPDDALVGSVILLWCVALPLLTRMLPRVGRWCNAIGIPIIPTRTWPLFVLTAYMFIYQPLDLTTELAELSFSIAVALVSLDVALAGRATFGGSRAYLGSLVAMLMLICGAGAALARSFPANEADMWQFHELASVGYPRHGMYHQAAIVFRYIDSHPRLLQPDSAFYEAIVLMRIGRQDAARKTLTRMLMKKERLQRTRPTYPEPFRDGARALSLLGQQDAAKRQFDIAVQLDQQRLEVAADPRLEAKARWSLAKTLYAMGETGPAEEQLSRAIEIAPHAYTRMMIRHWKAKEANRRRFMRDIRIGGDSRPITLRATWP